MLRRIQAGFTLLELLIVVTIIAILAAIAVPNFLEARTRSLLSRARSDLRTLSTALESYALEYNRYPPHAEILADQTVQFPATTGGLAGFDFAPGQPLTTPVAWISALPEDSFTRHAEPKERRLYGYVHSGTMGEILRRRGLASSAENLIPRYGHWRLYSGGPDGDKGGDMKLSVLYDPTNGTVSDGDLVRSQRNPEEGLSRDER